MTIKEALDSRANSILAIKKHLADLLNGLPLGVWLKDEKGKIVTSKIVQYSNKLHIAYINEKNEVLTVSVFSNNPADCCAEDDPILADVSIEILKDYVKRIPAAIDLYVQSLDKETKSNLALAQSLKERAAKEKVNV